MCEDKRAQRWRTGGWQRRLDWISASVAVAAAALRPRAVKSAARLQLKRHNHQREKEAAGNTLSIAL